MKGLTSWLVIPMLVALVTSAVALTPSATSRAIPAGPLAPDPELVRYDHAPAPTHHDTTLGDTILELEKRVAGTQPSPIDLADLANLFLRQGDPAGFAKAEATARRSIAILEQPNAAHLVLAKLANARHDFREAVRIAEAQLVHTRSPGAYNVLAVAHLALGELAQAAAATEAAVALEPTTPAYLTRALVMQAQGRDAEAAFDFARAAAVEDFGDPEEAARLRALWARFLVRRGELAGASALIDEALRLVPQDPLALAQRGELRLRLGDIDGAKRAFEAAFAASRQVRYLIDLARAQELGRDLDGATSTRAQAERIIRGDLEAHGVGHQLELVEVLVDRARPEDLREAITRAREEVERRPSAETRFQLARALTRSGAVEEAAAEIRLALASGARDARMYELAARLERGPRRQLYAREAEALDRGGSGWRTLGLDRVR